MKKIATFSLLFLMVWTSVLSQDNTTPCTARPLFCPGQMITGMPNNASVFGLNGNALGICASLNTRPTLFYKIKITGGGQFTFLIRPGTDANNNGLVDDPSEIAPVDYDWAVWINTNCNNLTTTAPVRLSFDQPPSYITGLVIPPANGTCENGLGTGFLDALAVSVGDELIIAVNFFNNGPIPPFQLVIGGTNGGSGNAVYNGIQYDLADANGAIKSTFCLGEKVILNGFGSSSNSFTVDLLPATGSTPLLTQKVSPGALNGMSLQSLFPYYNFLVSTSYRIKIKVNGPCGCYEVTRNLQFTCCNNSTDPSFFLSNEEGIREEYTADLITLSGEAVTLPGTHLWQLYNISQLSGLLQSSEPYTTVNVPKLTTKNPGPCYFIKHTLTNECGTGCSSQRYCKFSCNEKQCNLSVPQNLQTNGMNVSWAPVPGATKYILEFTGCDGACCPNTSNNVVAYVPPTLIEVQNTAYTIQQGDFGPKFGSAPPCFSWKVCAVCPDGIRSLYSSMCAGNPNAYCPIYWKPADVTSVQINDLSSNDIRIFPNPANGMVSIDVGDACNEGFVLTLINSAGEVLKEIENTKMMSKDSVFVWDTRYLNKGMYLVKVLTHKGKLSSGKLIIE